MDCLAFAVVVGVIRPVFERSRIRRRDWQESRGMPRKLRLERAPPQLTQPCPDGRGICAPPHGRPAFGAPPPCTLAAWAAYQSNRPWFEMAPDSSVKDQTSPSSRSGLPT